LVADHFDPVYVQRELRGWILRLPGLKIPRAIAVLADNRDPLSVHVAVREHRPLVGARLVHAVETVSEAYDHAVVPHDLEGLQTTVGDLLHLAECDVLLHRLAAPPGPLTHWRGTRPSAAGRMSGGAE